MKKEFKNTDKEELKESLINGLAILKSLEMLLTKLAEDHGINFLCVVSTPGGMMESYAFLPDTSEAAGDKRENNKLMTKAILKITEETVKKVRKEIDSEGVKEPEISSFEKNSIEEILKKAIAAEKSYVD